MQVSQVLLSASGILDLAVGEVTAFLIDVAGARISTEDKPGVEPSGHILIECWGGAGGTIDATNATIKTGGAFQSGNISLLVHGEDGGPPPDAIAWSAFCTRLCRTCWI